MTPPLIMWDAIARLGGRTVLNGAALQVHAGEFVALVGPNGAGKSSVIRAFAGLLPLTGGVARLGGDDVTTLSPRERAARAAYLPQERRIAWNLPAVEVAALGAAFLTQDERWSGRGGRWSRSRRIIWPTAAWPRCRAASGRGCYSRARWPRRLRPCWSMSRSPDSIPKPN